MGKTVNIDKLVSTASAAWRKADDTGEAGRIRAVLPLVKAKVPQSTFAKAAGLSSSSVSRYFKAAGYADTHGLTVAEIGAHGGNIVKAIKVKGGPEAMDKVGSKADLLTVSDRLASAKRDGDKRPGAAGKRKGAEVATRTTIAADANALRVKLAKVASGKDSLALTNADMEALGSLALLIAEVSKVAPVAKVVRRKAA